MTTPSLSAPAERGFITLAMVIVLIAVGLSTALAIVVSVAGMTDGEIVRRDGLRATWLADACVEHARAQLRTVGYTGGETLTLADGTCEVQPLGAPASGSYEIRASGTSGQAHARDVVTFDVVVDASSSATVTETAWQRVADF